LFNPDPVFHSVIPALRDFGHLNALSVSMGRAGRRKRDDLAYETFDGSGCSTGLQLELAPKNESGYAGVFPTRTSSRWQATIRVEREGKKVRRNVGTFGTKEEAAVQRALAIAGYGLVTWLALPSGLHAAKVRAYLNT
jgi:hypothetical protein